MTKDRILITGANGFIGRATVAAFLERGFPVNLAVREASRLPWSADNDKLRIIVTGDLAADDFASRLDPAFANVRAIVHLAGLAHIATADHANADSAFIRANVVSTKNLVDMALRHDVPSFVHLSSLAAITPNTSTDIVDDSTTTPPSTGYGRSKLAAETEVQKLASAGICAISLRPPLVTGTGARGNWATLQKLARTGLPLPFGSLQSKRSFASIETLTEAIVALCGKTPDHGLSGNYCLADMEALSVADVVTALREGMAMPPRLFRCPTSLFSMIGGMTGRQRQLAGLIGPLEVNPARFCATFGFRPTLPLVDAIRRSGAAFVRHVGS
ncbi:MAG: NAD-dependent epimerase/dehydratase family protein [Xanthobacteraceae bacterium]